MVARIDSETLTVLEDTRPWGHFRQYALNTACTVKVLTVAGGGALSLQRHTSRDELWIVMDAGLVIQIDDAVHLAEAGDEFFIPRATLHRLSSPQTGGRVVEVAFGNFDEDDIERLEDVYQR